MECQPGACVRKDELNVASRSANLLHRPPLRECKCKCWWAPHTVTHIYSCPWAAIQLRVLTRARERLNDGLLGEHEEALLRNVQLLAVWAQG